MVYLAVDTVVTDKTPFPRGADSLVREDIKKDTIKRQNSQWDCGWKSGVEERERGEGAGKWQGRGAGCCDFRGWSGRPR